MWTSLLIVYGIGAVLTTALIFIYRTQTSPTNPAYWLEIIIESFSAWIIILPFKIQKLYEVRKAQRY